MIAADARGYCRLQDNSGLRLSDDAPVPGRRLVDNDPGLCREVSEAAAIEARSNLGPVHSHHVDRSPTRPARVTILHPKDSLVDPMAIDCYTHPRRHDRLE